ncbi:hypothetical protein AX17_002929 [Amanita inopinata Kibby_2008]|nr:hypothetical protein AX17_002929 [Amanita inopinata Kibby_2008]
MKFAFRNSVILSTLLAIFPVATLQSAVTPRAGPGTAAGAAYWMNNDPSGNSLLVGSIGTNGLLTLTATYATGGTGGHGTGPTPDALFSAGSVTVSKTTNVVICVNAGSNTLSTFSINPSSPSVLTQLGGPVASGGNFPVSVAINAAGTVACTLNGGAVNGVSCFTINTSTGLSPLAGTTRSLGLTQTTPPSGPNMSVSQVAFSEDGTKLFALVKGSTATNTPGFLAMWTINSDGSLSSTFASMSGGTYPWSITYYSGATNAILTAEGHAGFDVFNLDAYASNPATTGVIYPVAGEIIVCWTAYSPGTGNYYLSDFGAGAIYEIHIDTSLNPTFVHTWPASQYSGNMDISIAKISGLADHLYVLSANNTNIDVFALNGAGSASLVQSLSIGSQASKFKIPYQPTYVHGMATWV